MIDETRPPLEDTTVRYYGQYVAVAVAETVEQARAAAEAVKVTYTKTPHNTDDKLWMRLIVRRSRRSNPRPETTLRD